MQAPYDQFVTDRRRASGTRAGSTSRCRRAASACRRSRCSRSWSAVSLSRRRPPTPLAPAADADTGLHAVRRSRRRLPARGARSADLRARLQAVGARPRAGRAGRVPWHPDRRGRRHRAAVRREDVRVLRRSPSGWTRRASASRSTTSRRAPIRGRPPAPIDDLVAHGVRAQLRSGSLLTGALYVAIDFFPDAPPATLDWSETPAAFPTVPGELEAIEANLASIVKKIDEMPLKAIGNDVSKALVELDRTLASARGDARHRRPADRAQLGSATGSRQHVAGSQPRGALDPCSRRLSRAPSRGAPARQVRGGRSDDRADTRHSCPTRAARRRRSPGCGATAPSRFYTLDAVGTSTGAPAGPLRRRRRTRLDPAAVDRPQFVIQVAAEQVDIDEFNRWAAPLEDGIARPSPATWRRCSARPTSSPARSPPSTRSTG